MKTANLFKLKDGTLVPIDEIKAIGGIVVEKSAFSSRQTAIRENDIRLVVYRISIGFDIHLSGTVIQYRNKFPCSPKIEINRDENDSDAIFKALGKSCVTSGEVLTEHDHLSAYWKEWKGKGVKVLT